MEKTGGILLMLSQERLRSLLRIVNLRKEEIDGTLKEEAIIFFTQISKI